MTRLGPNRYRLRYWADLGDGRGRVRHSETVRGTRAEARRRLSEREAFADEVSRAWGSYRSQGERDQLGPAN